VEIRKNWLAILLLTILGTVPLVLFSLGYDYLSLATKLVCLALAAASLNLILGYGGMVSFGHAVFIGIGAYSVGIPAYHSIYGELDWLASSNGLFHILLAGCFSGLFALITGAISLRTKGIHFIMITLAFSQMMFYFFVSLETYGGDDGLTLDERSQLPLINLDNPVHMFLLSFVILVIALFVLNRIVNSRFGMVLRGAKDNEERMRAIGYNTFAYRLTAYVIAGVMGGIAGALLANSEAFIFPEMIDWTRSGELIFMVLLGSAGTIIGPIVGAAVFIGVEEFLPVLMNSVYPGSGVFWHLPFGIALIISVLFARKGLVSLLLGRKADD
jgi:branched-chain amino acid transport system permease protein